MKLKFITLLTLFFNINETGDIFWVINKAKVKIVFISCDPTDLAKNRPNPKNFPRIFKEEVVLSL